MRKIKFIAYDYDTKKTYYDINVTFTTWGECLLELDYGDIKDNIALPNAILRQYTGLKDANGNEIYEGDILQYLPHMGRDLSEPMVVKYEHGTYVNYSIDGLGPRHFDFSKALRKVIMWGECTEALVVIGNIYENPELLKGE